MLIQQLKQNNLPAYALLSVLILILWVSGFSGEESGVVSRQMPFYELFARPLASLPLFSFIIALLLTIGEAFLINHIAVENELASKPSFLTAFVYMVFMGIDTCMFSLHPALIANLFLLLSFYSLSSSYRKEHAFSNAFDAGVLFSVATLFYPQAIIMLPVWCLGIFLIRAVNWREWVIFFIGIALPYLFVFTYYFWIDQLEVPFASKLFEEITDYSSPEYFSAFYVIICLSTLILLIAIISYIRRFQGASQKKIINTYLFAGFGLFSFLVLLKNPLNNCNNYTIFIIPFSIFTAEYFFVAKDKKWVNFIFALLFISIVVNILSGFI